MEIKNLGFFVSEWDYVKEPKMNVMLWIHDIEEQAWVQWDWTFTRKLDDKFYNITSHSFPRWQPAILEVIVGL